MLKKITKEELKNIETKFYFLSQKPASTCYPVFYDNIKSSLDFEQHIHKSFNNKDSLLFAFKHNNEICGLIQFFVIKLDLYLQLDLFLVEKYKEEALEDLLTYIQRVYPAYNLYFGFPSENTDCINYLLLHSFKVIEKDYNYSFDFSTYEVLDNPKYIEKITRSNYSKFAKLHKRADQNMYWNSDKIYSALDDWSIFIYEKRQVEAAIYYKECKNGIIEIFGVDFLGEENLEILESLVIYLLNYAYKQGKKYLVFFNDKKYDYLIKLGFEYIGKYVLLVR